MRTCASLGMVIFAGTAARGYARGVLTPAGSGSDEDAWRFVRPALTSSSNSTRYTKRFHATSKSTGLRAMWIYSDDPSRLVAKPTTRAIVHTGTVKGVGSLTRCRTDW